MIKIALSKGRIEKNFYKLLLEKNISKDLIDPKRSLKINVDDRYELLLVKSIDVIKLVSNKFADIGIVGSDVIDEVHVDNIIELFDLGTGNCSFALAGVPGTSVNDINLIATKYPNITRELIDEIGVNSEIVKMEGSLEIAPIINYADAIIDLVETGNTLRANGLVVLKKLKGISTKIVTNFDNKNNYEIKNFIKRLER